MDEIAGAAGKTRIAKAVAAVEKKSSAEIVAVLRRSSGEYRHVDLAFGAVVAIAVLCIFLYHPAEFDFTWFPLEQAASFTLGAIACAYVPPLRRALSSRAARTRNVERAARAAFVELGVSATKGRTGILVYLSAFERDVAVVTDVGIDRKALASDLETCEQGLRAAMRADRIEDFARALEALGDALERVHPVSPDDVDELPNEVVAA